MKKTQERARLALVADEELDTVVEAAVVVAAVAVEVVWAVVED